jgi:peptidyl-prolyl cis-trans isomerase C
MRKFLLAVLLGATALSGLAVAQAQSPAPASPPAAGAAQPAEDPIVARVNGLTVRRSEVDQLRESLPPQYQQVPFEVLFPIILDRLIDM